MRLGMGTRKGITKENTFMNKSKGEKGEEKHISQQDHYFLADFDKERRHKAGDLEASRLWNFLSDRRALI